MKTNYDAFVEMKMQNAKWQGKTRQRNDHALVKRGKCFLCGERCDRDKGICDSCEKEFPVRRRKI